MASTERLQGRLLFEAHTTAFQSDLDCAKITAGVKGLVRNSMAPAFIA